MALTAYVFQAALYCEQCGEDIKRAFDDAARDGERSTGNDDDSNFYPQGPLSDGGGEADCPQHCDACNAFLENALTDDGRAYVRGQLRAERVRRSWGKHVESPEGESVLDTWAKFYGLEL